MNDVFPDLAGYETQTEFMQKRTLLEFIMIKHVIEETRIVPLDTILNEADIPVFDKSHIGFLLQAVFQNNVVFLNHHDLYNGNYITKTTYHDITMECNPFRVEKWINNATGKKDIHSFSYIEQKERDCLIAELVEKIKQMKKIISSK